MKRKGLISLGHTLFSNVINFNKKSKQPQVSLPLIYAGSWQFIDELSNRTHCLEITADLRIFDYRIQLKKLVCKTAYGLFHIQRFSFAKSTASRRELVPVLLKIAEI